MRQCGRSGVLLATTTMLGLLGWGALTAGAPAHASNYLEIEPSIARPGDRVVVSAHCDFTMDPDFRFPGGSPLTGLAEKRNGTQVVRVGDDVRPGGYRIEMFCLAKETSPHPLAVGTLTVRAPAPKPPSTRPPRPDRTQHPRPERTQRPRPERTQPPRTARPPVTRMPTKGAVDTGGGATSGITASGHRAQPPVWSLAGPLVVAAGLGVLLVRRNTEREKRRSTETSAPAGGPDVQG